MKEYEILSLDIWDTVLRRRCHPDEIKLATARYLYFTYFTRIKTDYRDVQRLVSARVAAEKMIAGQHLPEYDDEYSIRDVFSTMLRNVLKAAENIPQIVEDLYMFELNKETEMSYLDPGIVDTIKRQKFKRLGYISDFYAGLDFIDTLLERAGFPYQISFRYVSCDYGLNKRSGRLYQKVLNDLGVEPKEQLHIGDSRYSDFEVPGSMGIDTLYYEPTEECSDRRKRESLYSIEAGSDIKRIVKQFYGDDRLETELAPFFTAFVLWILEDCVKRGIRKIYYFTREGEFFIQLHKVIGDSGLFPASILPQAEILEVSRISTFAASLQSVTLEEMMRLWNQYSNQSMGAFGRSVSIDDSELSPWLERYELDLDEVITYPWMDERVQRLFQDEEFIAFFQLRVDSLRELAKSYFREKGLTDEGTQVCAIVDIGWRGTIQDNICCLYPKRRFVGYYLALEQFLNAQPVNSEKYGYLNGLPNYSYLLRIVAPIEMLCNSPNGSTIGYERMPDGHTVAIRKKDPGEEQIYTRFTKNFQMKLLEKANEICKILNTHSLFAGQIREETYYRFAELLLSPHKHRDLIYAFFQLRHNEEFGIGGYVDKRTQLRLNLLVKAVLSKSGRRELNDFLNSTSWPQGYLVKYHLNPLVSVYNRMIGVR